MLKTTWWRLSIGHAVGQEAGTIIVSTALATAKGLRYLPWQTVTLKPDNGIQPQNATDMPQTSIDYRHL